MRVLVVGGGGREHALCWKLAQSPRVSELLCAPGNAGIAGIARCLPVKADDVPGIVKLALEERAEFVVVAPDDPLALGCVDALTEAGIRAFGPTRSAARLESSKIYAKELMRKYHIPTAGYRVFDTCEEALAYVEACGAPLVIKADGLALGKGVVVAETLVEAREAVHGMLEGNRFGRAGARVLIEECMTGPEVTLLCLTDGETIVPMLSSQDHKRALDGDQGPNTGGMGAVAPSPHYTPDVAERIEREIVRPTLEALRSEGIDYRGVLYIGLMLTSRGPRVVEYNARFGDPEAQALLPLLQSDLLDALEAAAAKELTSGHLLWREGASACVVLASGGYPGAYSTGKRIRGVERAERTGAIVFHAGTAKAAAGDYVTAGGRVLGVTTCGATLEQAVSAAYAASDEIVFDGMYMRRDIGRNALR